MNRLPKYVVTRGPYQSAWANSPVLSCGADDDLAGAVRRLKAEPGRDLPLFAGAGAAQSLAELGLIDKYRLVLNPALLGGGTPLFRPAGRRAPLKLIGTRAFGSGAVVLTYQPLPT